MTSQCLYLQFLSSLVDNDKLIKLYPLFHYEHAEVIAALLYPITACILLIAEIEFVAYGADALVGPYLPVTVGHEAFLADVQDIDHIAVIQQLHKSTLAQYGTVAVNKAGSTIYPELLVLPILIIYNMVYGRILLTFRRCSIPLQVIQFLNTSLR